MLYSITNVFMLSFGRCYETYQSYYGMYVIIPTYVSKKYGISGVGYLGVDSFLTRHNHQYYSKKKHNVPTTPSFTPIIMTTSKFKQRIAIKFYRSYHFISI